MKYVFMMLLGFLLGCALVMVGLFFNPLTADSNVVAGVNARVLSYSSPFSEGLAMTHNGQSRLPLQPATIPELWEGTIRDSMLSVVVLHDDADEPVGIASRVSQFSEGTEMLTRGVLVNDDWLVTIAGEGSFFINANSNLWPFLKDTLIPVWYLDRPWEGPKNYRPTSGPTEDGSALVSGGTGLFSDIRGTAVESYQVSEFDSVQGPGSIDARLFVQLPVNETNLAAE